MARSSNPVRAQRINAARELLTGHLSSAQAARQLAGACGISMRQAYRYVQAARRQQQPVAIPEQKIPFTVKLAPSVVTALRQHASKQKMSLGKAVQLAITAYLEAAEQRG
ncbi:MAG: hypothetical protein IIB77_11680 [Proteobacteria bacterium]|nr:hypothetical protein [Pseudomonadota bacterium]